MSKATVIAKLVEAGHEDLAEQLAVLDEATGTSAPPELATAASTHLWDIINKSGVRVMHEAAEEVKKRLPLASFGKTGHDEVSLDKVIVQGPWLKLSGTYYKWVGRKKHGTPWEAIVEIQTSAKLLVQAKGGKARGAKAKEVPGMANGYNITDGRIAQTVINLLNTGKM